MDLSGIPKVAPVNLPTVAEMIDDRIKNRLILENPQSDAEELIQTYDVLPSSVSKEEFYEFAKRNLEEYTKLVLESLKDGLR